MRVILAYKNFAANKNISHIGLGVAGLNTCKTLQSHGIACEVWAITDSNHLRQLINLDHHKHHSKITHVVVSAPWIATQALHHLCTLFPHIHFAVNCHSNVGFLQADPNGVRHLREDLNLEMMLPNFSVAANSKKMAHWVEDAYGHPCRFLPNLYYLNPHSPHMHHRPWSGGTLHIGAFGAVRPQKNLASSVAAAIEIAHQLKAETKIWVSAGRTEGGASTVLNAIKQMVKDIPNFELKEAGWRGWPEFRRLVRSMHLLLQPSYTESFNMVTADGIAEGVPSVVSEAIDWAPRDWRASIDDVFDIARVGIYLLRHQRAPHEGKEALKLYLEAGLKNWKSYFDETLKSHSKLSSLS